MSVWNDVVLTAKGQALQAKLVASGEGLNITKVLSGSGRVAVEQLQNQTAVSNSVQNLQVSPYYDAINEHTSLNVFLTNLNLETGYTLNQIGIYAEDPDDGEILYILAQADSGEPIPSIVNQPAGYTCEWNFILEYSSFTSDQITVTVDPTGFVRQEDLMPYAKITYLNSYVTKTLLKETLNNSDYVTNAELDDKGFVTNEELDDKNYVTKTDLNNSDFVTNAELEETLDNTSSVVIVEEANAPAVSERKANSVYFIITETL